MSSNGPPAAVLQPDADAINRWAATWFATCNRGCIEVAWSDKHGKPTLARQFALGDPALGVFAAEMNRQPGINVYLMPATTSRKDNRRSADKHVLQSPGFWVDQDTVEQVNATANILPILLPQYWVITGQHPYLRRHAYFLTSQAISDPNAIRAFNDRLIKLYGSDETSKNPSRLLRCPYTIAWPIKPGRIPEMTFVRKEEKCSRGHYSLAHLEANLPPLAAPAPTLQPTTSKTGAQSLADGPQTFNQLLNRLRSSDQGRHDALIRTCASMHLRGNPAEVIVGFLSRDEFNVPDHNGKQETAEGWQAIVEKVVNSDQGRLGIMDGEWIAQTPLEAARCAFGPVPDIGLPQGAPLARPHMRERLVSPLQCRMTQRQYIVKGLLALGDVATITAAPGVGKSIVAPSLGYMVATGMRPFRRRVRQCKVLYVAAEDYGGMQQRVTALLHRHGDAGENFQVVDCQSLLVAGGETSADGVQLLEVVRESKISLVIIDTLAAAFAGIDENSSRDMGWVVSFVRRLASLGCAVLLIHHPTKNGGNDLPRGHSVLNGTLDVSIGLDRQDDGTIKLKLLKNRNGPLGTIGAIRIEVLTVGTDNDHEAVTAPLAFEVAEVMVPQPGRLSPMQSRIMDVLGQISRNANDGVPEADWVQACEDRQISTGATVKDRRKILRRLMRHLANQGHVVLHDGKYFNAFGKATGDRGPVGTKGGQRVLGPPGTGDRGDYPLKGSPPVPPPAATEAPVDIDAPRIDQLNAAEADSHAHTIWPPHAPPSSPGVTGRPALSSDGKPITAPSPKRPFRPTALTRHSNVPVDEGAFAAPPVFRRSTHSFAATG